MGSQKPFSRTVQDLGNGCVEASIPVELHREHDLEPGDEVGIDYDRDEGTVTYHLD